MSDRYVYLIFYDIFIFFCGVCARYNSGIHFSIALYLYKALLFLFIVFFLYLEIINWVLISLQTHDTILRSYNSVSFKDNIRLLWYMILSFIWIHYHLLLSLSVKHSFSLHLEKQQWQLLNLAVSVCCLSSITFFLHCCFTAILSLADLFEGRYETL